MGILDLFQNGPYMQNPRPLKNVDWNVFKLATYQIVPSEHGVPMVRLELDFRRPTSSLFTLARGWTFPSSTINPDMTMAVLLDKSGSMSGTFSEGHAYNCCWNILNHLQSADHNLGYDLVFYSDQVYDAGHVNSQPNLNSIIRRTRPSGGTLVTEALKQTIKTHHKKRGLYVLVITDGEFQDKQRVQEYITQSILPQLTLENPYAYRLHFVGAGEGADERFLHQLEAVCSGQGFQLVTSHHHAHLSHSHEGMLDEIDRAYLGPGWDFEIAESGFLDNTADSESTVLRVGNVVTREWSDGPIGRFQFLPRHMVMGLEYKPTHPGTLPVQLRFRDAFDKDRMHEFEFKVPLPKQDEVDTFAHKFVWPVLRQLQGGGSDANVAIEQEANRIHEEEIIRQAKDLEALSRGGIPVSAQERLKELLEDKEHLFTSNLSPAELGLMRSKGYKARGIVTGTAMYHIGAAFASVTDCEVRQLTEAYDRATELAVQRMAEELRVIGAHGVIGVRLKLSRHEWGDKTIEVQAIGTAIEGPGAAP
ncbi:MAG: heavy metal-binding domain-containing protein, partial [Candidatus Obscuribacterales bacterium]|nr:heavy metal-binding domain-containing protein [Candidatus Obscuribacterales bacterium]